jgi:hypothetical protein
VEGCRSSRDVPAPRPIRLAAATRPPAGVWLLGTCSLGAWTKAPLVRVPQLHVQSSPVPRSFAATTAVADLYTVVARDGGVSCQLIVGEMRN